MRMEVKVVGSDRYPTEPKSCLRTVTARPFVWRRNRRCSVPAIFFEARTGQYYRLREEHEEVARVNAATGVPYDGVG